MFYTQIELEFNSWILLGRQRENRRTLRKTLELRETPNKPFSHEILSELRNRMGDPSERSVHYPGLSNKKDY